MTFSTNRRSFIVGTGALGVATALGLPQFAQAAEPKKGGVFKIGMSDSATDDSLDPKRAETKFQLNLNWQVRNNLIEVGPGGSLVPELATEWASSNNATEWVFTLRKGVEFHNGKPLVAADVVFSVNMHRGEGNTSEIASLVKTITDVKATGDHEVTMTLDGPNSSLPSLMTLVNLVIVPDGTTDFEDSMGTGPYILESFEPGVKSVAKRNPNYWKEGRAHFDSVETIAISDATARTNALRTGEIHAMNSVDPTTANLLNTLPGIEVMQTQGKVHYCYTMKTDDPVFKDARVRTAMKLAIDRQDMVDKILGGFGSVANDQPISTAYAYHNASIPQREYDPDQARSLLKAAGVSDLKVRLHASDTPFKGAVDGGQLFAEHAAKAGITIEVSREPEDGYWSNVWGVKPFFASRWSGRPNEDLMLTLAYSQASLGGWNASGWDNDAFNKALLAARGETDEKLRTELYAECQALIHENSGLIAPVWADFLDARSDKIVVSDEISSEWDLDGQRCAERWSMA